jgi:mannitol operon repressor
VDDAQLSQTFAEVFGQTDRASAIVAAALLEEVLERLLLAFILEHDTAKRDLVDGMAPLSTLSAKINASFHLGLISEAQFEDLKIIKDVRNDFAHSFEPITFETPRIKDRCMRLRTLSDTEPPKELMDGLTTIKMFYQVNTSLLASTLHWQAGHVGHLRPFEYPEGGADEAGGSGVQSPRGGS